MARKSFEQALADADAEIISAISQRVSPRRATGLLHSSFVRGLIVGMLAAATLALLGLWIRRK